MPKRFSVIKSLSEASKSLRLLIASITFLASAFGKEVRLVDFIIEFFIKLAKEKKGINFKTLLVA